jgi:hypothetical protein
MLFEVCAAFLVVFLARPPPSPRFDPCLFVHAARVGVNKQIFLQKSGDF